MYAEDSSSCEERDHAEDSSSCEESDHSGDQYDPASCEERHLPWAKGSLVELISSWRCGTVVKIARQGFGFVADVDFDGGTSSKIRSTDLRKVRAIVPPRSKKYSDRSISPWPRVGWSGSLRCLSKDCSFQVHSDAFFGSYCCRWCLDSGGAQHGRYCERRVARLNAPRATRNWLVHGGTLSEIWCRMAAVSKCRPDVVFNSLSGALFKSMIFAYFVDPRCTIKPTPWPCAAQSSASTFVAWTAVCKSPVASAACASHLGHQESPGMDDDRESSMLIMDNLSCDDAQPAASIPPEEAAQIASTQWASAAEWKIQCGTHLNTADVSADGVDDQLMLLTFGRHPKEFECALAESDLAQMLSTRGVDLKPAWGNGAKIMADGVAEEMFDRLSVELSNKNVIVRAKDEHKVYDALNKLPYAQRPRLKRERGRLPVELDPEDVSHFADASDDDSHVQETTDVPESSSGARGEFGDVVKVKWTFIHLSASSSSGARTVSTSQMRQLSIRNPRPKVSR